MEIYEGDFVRFDPDSDWLEVERVSNLGWGEGVTIEINEEPGEWIVFPDRDAAGEAARDYWEELMENDPEEFRAIVGDEALVAWAMGQTYAPGSVAVCNVEEWLDLWLDYPEDEWARYDGDEWEGTIKNAETGEEEECILYRSN